MIGTSEGALGVQNGTVDETAPPSASTGVHIPDASTSADRGGKPLVKVFDRFSPMSSLSFQSTGPLPTCPRQNVRVCGTYMLSHRACPDHLGGQAMRASAHCENVHWADGIVSRVG